MNESSNSNPNKKIDWDKVLSLEFPIMERHIPQSRIHDIAAIIKLSEAYLRRIVGRPDFETIRAKEKYGEPFKL